MFAVPGSAADFLPPDLGSGSGSELLARSRAAWELGDWDALAALTETPLEDNRDRAKLALLAAVGLAQLGRMDLAQTYAGRAQDWGCPATLIARVLVGGVLNSLGRVASLLDDAPLARQYFEGSVQVVSPGADATILGRARNISEKAGLGLLPEAARLMEKSLDHMQANQAISAPEVAIFKSQVQLLNHTLALAQKRHQLLPVDSALPETPDLESRATSQLGQDLWVLEQTGHKQGGFFVEFGATDGVLLSNTFLLETGFGWTGICAEPNPQFFRKLRTNRSCITVPDCIMGRTGQTVEFILADEYGGAAEFAHNDNHSTKRAAFQANGETITLQSISLEDLLKKYGAPQTIDYLSIDTEGSEYEILKAFPFDEWDIRLLTVEHNFTPIREDIRLLLEGHGYTCTEMQWDDWYSRTPPA
ncbi:MAG: hypothetical protein COC12_00010 [Rhodobacteraceae bacterium]|nr:MAG: hypothetical protein COC12_00010 [Paracoccaceae bacterium]